MRPRVLRLTAFGPYKNTLELDFDHLGGHGLFLLHGPTGAGKTTILDAMCFALYGETSGGEREMKELRSDRAAHTAVARVEFEFSLGESRYRIERSPTQSRPGRKTDLQHQAELTRLSPDGPTLLESGVTDVKSRVYDLLGLTAEQFRQVVVLPQGQFRQLLTADSKEREGILKVLFDTTAVLTLEKQLVDRAAAAVTLARDSQRERDAILGTHGALTIQDLEQLTERRRDEGRDADEHVIATKTMREQARAALDQAREVDAAFQAFEQAYAQHEHLSLHSAERAARAERLASANRARQVQPLERAIQESAALLQSRVDALRQVEDLTAIAEAAWRESQVVWQQEEARADERRAAAQRVHTLGELQGTVDEYEDLQRRLQEARVTFQTIQARLPIIERELQQLGSAELHESVREAELAAQAVQDLTREMSEQQTRINIRQELEEVDHGLISAARDDEAARQEVTRHEQLWTSRKLAHALTLQRMLDDQAGGLAETLQEGEPCSVCGSRHHPSPARRAHDAVTRNDVARSASQEDSAWVELRQAQTDAASAAHALSAAQQRRAALLGAMGRDAATPLLQLQAAHHLTRELLSASQAAAAQLGNLRLQYDALRTRQSELERERSALQQECDRLAGAIAVTEQQERSLEQRLPDHVRSATALRELREQASRTASSLEQDFTDARDREQALRREWDQAAQQVNLHQALLNDPRNELTRHQRAFESALVETGFMNEAAYRTAVLEPSDLADLTDQVQQDEQVERDSTRLLAETQRATEGKVRPALQDIAAAHEQAESAYEDAVRHQAKLTAEIKMLEKGHSQATDLENVWLGAQRSSQRLEELAAAAKGSKGQRISFHRYVLGACLDETLIIASRRLRAMSRERYELRRADDGRGGLELEVFDHHTGRARSTRSLSGGESFQAALSLALSLADVVQERSGGRYLETVFIDEGFGSLDPDSLDLAMDCLTELQSNGRLVGIISHVQEIRHHVEARLEVLATSDGSTARFVVNG